MPASQTRSSLEALSRRLGEARGSDRDLDRSIAEALSEIAESDAVPALTSSVDDCLALLQAALPGWHWHVGHGPRGILPYASLTKPAGATATGELHFEASAPTVPLSLLRAIVQAYIAELVRHG